MYLKRQNIKKKQKIKIKLFAFYRYHHTAVTLNIWKRISEESYNQTSTSTENTRILPMRALVQGLPTTNTQARAAAMKQCQRKVNIYEPTNAYAFSRLET
jgi:hypothetical protein